MEGAQLTLYGPDKTEIDSWTSSDKPHRVEHLAPGTYSLREMMSPRTYDLAEEITFEIRTTLKKGGLLLGYNPRAPGSRLKARARTSSRPSAS